MSDDEPRQNFRADLEDWGVDEVRSMLALGRFGRTNGKDKYAELWLQEKEAERAAGVEADKMQLARSAKDAAWASAKAAQEAASKAGTANTIATVAMIVAIISIAVTALGLFLGK